MRAVEVLPRINDVTGAYSSLSGNAWVVGAIVAQSTPQQTVRFVISRDGLRSAAGPLLALDATTASVAESPGFATSDGTRAAARIRKNYAYAQASTCAQGAAGKTS